MQLKPQGILERLTRIYNEFHKIRKKKSLNQKEQDTIREFLLFARRYLGEPINKPEILRMTLQIFYLIVKGPNCEELVKKYCEKNLIELFELGVNELVLLKILSAIRSTVIKIPDLILRMVREKNETILDFLNFIVVKDPVREQEIDEHFEEFVRLKDEINSKDDPILSSKLSSLISHIESSTDPDSELSLSHKDLKAERQYAIEPYIWLNRETSPKDKRYNVFICHASEDKDSFVRPLTIKLKELKIKVWFDESEIKLGDSLRRKIDEGLAKSQYGVVVLSPHFFAKEWPQRELDGLTSREINGEKVILPVWHNIEIDDVREFSPILADRVAARSSDGIENVAKKIFEALFNKKLVNDSPLEDLPEESSPFEEQRKKYNKRELEIKAISLRQILVERATGRSNRSKEFETLRKDLLAVKPIRQEIPAFLEACQDLNAFWEYIKVEYDTYAERRVFLKDEFISLINCLKRA